jgi:hypothetical protein
LSQLRLVGFDSKKLIPIPNEVLTFLDNIQFISSLKKADESTVQNNSFESNVNQVFNHILKESVLQVFNHILKERKDFTGHFGDLHSLITSKDLEK